MTKNPDNSGNKQVKDTRFKPGQSGNPAGKKPGTRHRITLLAEKLLAEDAEEVVKKCIEMAKEGDTTCMRLVLERLLPPRKKDRPILIDLPQIENLQDASRAMTVITKAVGSGEITPEEGQGLAALMESYRKTVETTDLEARIRKLEESKGFKK